MKNPSGYSYYRTINREEMNKAILEKRMAHAERMKKRRPVSKKKKKKYKSTKSGIEVYPYVHPFVHFISTPMK